MKIRNFSFSTKSVGNWLSQILKRYTCQLPPYPRVGTLNMKYELCVVKRHLIFQHLAKFSETKLLYETIYSVYVLVGDEREMMIGRSISISTLFLHFRTPNLDRQFFFQFSGRSRILYVVQVDLVINNILIIHKFSSNFKNFFKLWGWRSFILIKGNCYIFRTIFRVKIAQ